MKRNESQTLAPIAAARLGQHPSHSRVAFQAAARVTAGWPSPEEFARGTDDLTFRPDLGMWVRGGRRDSDDEESPFARVVIHHDDSHNSAPLGLRTDSVGVAYDNGFRMDGAITRDTRVADAALAVLQAMQEIGRSYSRMDAQTRASAQLAVGAGRRFLQAAGVRSVGA